MVLHTTFTHAFGIAVPVVGAPMAGVSGPDLTAAVARAGGLGLIGAAIFKDGDEVRSAYEAVKKLNGGSSRGIGIGLVGFTNLHLLDPAIDLKPEAIWISFGDYADMARRVKAAGIKLIIQVQKINEALQAAALGADAIVAQGNESGGHGASSAGTFCFVPEVVDALDKHARDHGRRPIPVLAAGGVTDGRQVAAALCLGAAGVVLGTRLVVTHESVLSADKKDRYVAAPSAAETQRTVLYDALMPLQWPPAIDGRVLRNRFTEENPDQVLCEEKTRSKLQKELQEAQRLGDLEKVPLWCGGGVGLIRKIEHAETVVRDVVAEAEKVLASASATAKA